MKRWIKQKTKKKREIEIAPGWLVEEMARNMGADFVKNYIEVKDGKVIQTIEFYNVD